MPPLRFLTARGVLVAGVLACAACADTTSVRIVVEADSTVRARTRDLHVRVDAERASTVTRYEETRLTSEIGWPAVIALAPPSGSVEGRLEIEVTARDPAGGVVSRGAVSTAYIAHASRGIQVLLTAACAQHACVPDEDRDSGPRMIVGDGGALAMDAGACAPERCDGVHDEDCDTRVDEGCDCTDGASRTCAGEERGACEPGTQACAGGRWGACRGRIEAAVEACNGTDDDCDGDTDEDLTLACAGDHRCKRSCRRGEWGRCERHGDACDDDD